MNDALLLVDLFDDYAHEDGERLARSFSERLPALRQLLAEVRRARIPVIYANDRHGHWHSDVQRFLADLGHRARVLEPHEDDAFFFKDRYSAFDHTALAVLLEELETDRLIIAGSTFEGCVTQTSIDARELGLKVTVDEAACPRIDPSSAAAASAYLERVVGVRISGIATRADPPGGLPDGSRGGSTL